MRIRDLKPRSHSVAEQHHTEETAEISSEEEINIHSPADTISSEISIAIPDETEERSLNSSQLQHFSGTTSLSKERSIDCSGKNTAEEDEKGYMDPDLGGYASDDQIPACRPSALNEPVERPTEFVYRQTMAEGGIPVYELTDRTEFGYVRLPDIQNDEENEADDEWDCPDLSVEGVRCPRRLVRSANLTRHRRLDSSNILEELREANVIKGTKNKYMRQSLGGVAWEIFITAPDGACFRKPPVHLDILDVKQEKEKLRADEVESRKVRCDNTRALEAASWCDRAGTSKVKKTKKTNKEKKKVKARKSGLQVVEDYKKPQNAKKSVAAQKQLDRDNPTPTMDYWGHRSPNKARPVSRVKGIVQPGSLSETDVTAPRERKAQLPVATTADSPRKALSHPSRMTSPDGPLMEYPRNIVIDMKKSESSLYRTVSDGSHTGSGSRSSLHEFEDLERMVQRYEREMLENDDFVPLSPE